MKVKFIFQMKMKAIKEGSVIIKKLFCIRIEAFILVQYFNKEKRYIISIYTVLTCRCDKLDSRWNEKFQEKSMVKK